MICIVSQESMLMEALQISINSKDVQLFQIQALEEIMLNFQGQYIMKAIILDSKLNFREADINSLRKVYPTSFIVMHSPEAATKPFYRLALTDAGCNMIAHDIESILKTLHDAVIFTNIANSSSRAYRCPYCHLQNLTELEMWLHIPTFHVNFPSDSRINDERCPICFDENYKRPLQVHIHVRHGPSSKYKPYQHYPMTTTQLYSFSLVIVKHPITGLYLLCQEFANQGFWCPGGAIDENESVTAAAIRETIEETGIHIDLKGILSFEYHSCGQYQYDNKYLVRLRIVFYAEPTMEDLYKLPKSIPDFESVGASWCSIEDINNGLRLRGDEPKTWINYIHQGGQIYPLSILQEKGKSVN